jgi:hypothetical protein
MKENLSSEINKSQAITQEIEASYSFIKEGIILLVNQKSAISNNHVSLQLFSSGFERLAKILLLLKEKQTSGNYPTTDGNKNYFGKYDNGHGINKMIDDLILYSDKVAVMKRIPILIDDMEFLRTNEKFRNFLNIITDFSKHQRYYYIDTIVKIGRQENNSFDKFKNLICSYSEELDISKLTYDEEELYVLNSMIITIEKGVRAISRFFTHGFGDEGKRYYGDFDNFFLLNDKDLGKLKYLIPKAEPQNDYSPMNWFSFRFIKIELLSKKRIISSIDFPNWPFLVDEVKVINYKNGKYCFVQIKDGVFALNATAVNYYKIPTYFASKYLKPRQYMLELLTIAQQL